MILLIFCRLFLFAIVIALLLICSLWKKRHTLFCTGWSTSSNHRTPSEGDSAGSCYAPPHYSRCSSFYHAPPPYNEVRMIYHGFLLLPMCQKYFFLLKLTISFILLFKGHIETRLVSISLQLCKRWIKKWRQ